MSTSSYLTLTPNFNSTATPCTAQLVVRKTPFTSGLSALLQNTNLEQCCLLPASLSLPRPGNIYIYSAFMKVSLTLKRKARHAQEHSAVAMIYFGLSTRSYYRQLHPSGFFDTHPCQGMLILTTPKPSILFHKPQNSFLQCTSQTHQCMHLN